MSQVQRDVKPEDGAIALAVLCLLDEAANLKRKIARGVDSDQRAQLESVIAESTARIEALLGRSGDESLGVSGVGHGESEAGAPTALDGAAARAPVH